MATITEKLKQYFTEELWNIDLGSESGSRRFFIKSLRLVYAIVSEFREGELTLRAMSLVYTTILALVPLLAVSFSVLKGFGVHNQAGPLIRNFLEPLGEKGEELTVKIIGFLDNVNAGVLGSLGLVLLIYTVISLIHKIEDAFNHIWKIKRSRSFIQRFSDYTSTILIGPILIFTAIGITASVMNTAIVQKMQSVEPLGTLFFLAGKVVPFLLVCIAFSFVYVFVPNTKVRFRAALTGGIFAGILWQLSGWAFAAFIANSTRQTAIYSGFAIMLFFMIWLYLSWLILLLGGEISFYYQYPQFLTVRKEHFQLSNRLKERLALLILVLIGFRFHNRSPNWTLDSLIERLRLPLEPIQDVLTLLEQKKLIIKTSDNPPQFIPATDLGMIKLKEFWWTIRGAEEDAFSIEEKYLSTPAVDNIVEKWLDAISKALGEETVMDVVLKHEEPEGSES
jgi:membrane protein